MILTSPVSEKAEHADAKPAAEIAVALVRLAAPALGRDPRRDPDLVCRGRAIDGLKDELQIEAHLQLADHDNRRIALAQTDKVASPDFALDGITCLFEKAFDRQIKRRFHGPAEFIGNRAISTSIRPHVTATIVRAQAVVPVP